MKLLLKFNVNDPFYDHENLKITFHYLAFYCGTPERLFGWLYYGFTSDPDETSSVIVIGLFISLVSMNGLMIGTEDSVETVKKYPM